MCIRDRVKRIFAMTIDGYGPYQIASKLKSEKVLISSAYLAQHGEGVNKNKTFKDVYGWGSSTICNLLEKREYLGPVSYTHLCRAVYDAGFSPVCPTLFLPLFLRDEIPQEHKDGIDMAREYLRRAQI